MKHLLVKFCQSNSVGGGKFLYISNILIDFGDAVLWFIKALIPLYMMFYVFSIIDKYNRKWSLFFLLVSSLIIVIWISDIFAAHNSISIPFFTLGILISKFRYDKRIFLGLMFVVCIVIAIVSYLMLDNALAYHSIINSVCILILFVPLFIKSIDIKISNIFGLLSFDLYLVHNKVLMALKDNLEIVDVWIFISLSIVSTLVFLTFRNKILKIK